MRSWTLFRFASISSSGRLSRLPVPKIAFRKAEASLSIRRIVCDRELGAADLLAAKQVADCFDGLELVVEVGFKVEFHYGGSEDLFIRRCR